jgi:hypothetical protein
MSNQEKEQETTISPQPNTESGELSQEQFEKGCRRHPDCDGETTKVTRVSCS